MREGTITTMARDRERDWRTDELDNKPSGFEQKVKRSVKTKRM